VIEREISMILNTTELRGTVRGKTGKMIELDEETGLPEGQAVAVTVQPLIASAQRLPPGEGLRRAFGAWSDDAEELDKYLEWNRRQRKISRAEIDP
jgi:hypothetical protein